MPAPLTPTRIEYDLGPNQHGQQVKLFRESRRWILIRDQANQRDDTARVEMTDEQARQLAGIFGIAHD